MSFPRPANARCRHEAFIPRRAPRIHARRAPVRHGDARDHHGRSEPGVHAWPRNVPAVEHWERPRRDRPARCARAGQLGGGRPGRNAGVHRSRPANRRRRPSARHDAPAAIREHPCGRCRPSCALAGLRTDGHEAARSLGPPSCNRVARPSSNLGGTHDRDPRDPRIGRFQPLKRALTVTEEYMIGAIAGDVIGSVHEFMSTKSEDFSLFVPGSRFTDDTVLAVAVADCLLNGRPYVDTFHEYFLAYPNAGYGFRFFHWASAGRRDAYNSYGNGSAMRVPAVAYAFETLDEVLAEAARSAEVTHDHPEGIKGAQATAAAVFMARQGETKRRMRDLLGEMFGYDLNASVDQLRPTYEFDVTCQGTVPAALVAFFDSHDYEDAVRKAISLGGDADTLACIAGAVAEAYYGGVPPHIARPAREALDDRLRKVVGQFYERYKIRAA